MVGKDDFYILGTNIFNFRKSLHKSREEFAELLQEKLNISISTKALEKWEQGVSCPTIDKLLALSEFMGVTINRLLKESIKQFPTNDEQGKKELAFRRNALLCCIEKGEASANLLQREFKIGYARAAELIDYFESEGYVSAYSPNGRTILIDKQALQNKWPK